MNDHDNPPPNGLLDIYRAALDRMSELVSLASTTTLDGPTPCATWNIQRLIEHSTGLNAGFAQAFREGVAPEEAYGDQPVSAWSGSVQAVLAAAESPTSPREVWVAPVTWDAPFLITDAIRIHLLDVVVHSWDLAVALGVEHDPDDATVAAISETAGLIASRRVPSTRDQFAAPIRPPEGEAPGWRRVLRLLGRDPDWRPGDGDEGAALTPVNLAERLGRFTETWSPKIVGRINDYEIKVVKMLGEFEWHSHPHTDELFLVVTGSVRIEMEHGSVTLAPGEMFVVPQGVRHRPVAEEQAECVLLEPAGVVNTGDAGGRLTAVDEILV